MNPYQTGYQRVVALLIDNFILYLSLLPISWLISINLSIASNVIFGVIGCVIPVGYSTYMHGRFGQTIGKYICGVRVITLDGKRISFHQAIMRDVVPFIVLPVWIWTITYTHLYGEYPPSVMFRWAQNLGVYWAILELITMLFNEQRRAIHDYIAKTVVVRVNRPF